MKDETSTIANAHQTRRQIPQQGYDQDDGIDLRKYVAAAFKRKEIVLAVMGGAVLVTAIWNFVSPKVYAISVLLGPTVIAVSDAGVQEYEPIENVKAQIEAGAFNEKIINELNIDPESLDGAQKLNVTQVKDSKIIKVSLTRTADETDLGKKMLTALIQALDLNYAKFIEDKRNGIENQIKLVRIQIAKKENEMRLKSLESKILADREQQLIEDLKEAKTDSERFSTDRVRLFEQNGNKDAGTSLLYVATIQQSMGYFSQFKAELSDVKIKKESILNGIENLKNGINGDQIGIENLKLSENVMHNIVVVQEPLVSKRPIGPKMVQNILLAAVAGLMAGLFAACSIESWEGSAA